MPEIHATRRHALRERFADAELDALLVTDLRNIRYLTGFTGSNAALLVHGDGDERSVFCTDGRYTTQAEAQVPDLRQVIERASASALVREAADRLARGAALGFESQHVSVEQHATFADVAENLVLTRAPGLVEQLREVKDDTEIAALRAACAAADRALADLLEHGGLRAGRSELEVARDLENRMADHGAEAVAFPSIVAAGANSAIPHHRPTDAVLAVGDFVKLDFGAVVDGYHSDMTRTLVLGEPAQWQRDLYALVATAQAAGTDAVRPGQEVSAVDAAARGVIADAGHGEHFTHGLGHGVGLDVHEAPSLAKTGVGTLSACMAVTVEPGVYLTGRGGVRIEDTLVVREGTPELLTMSTKELVVA